ncbi:hypothetical protein DPMN_048176 [Dreissena polymorpha]|uniref:Uncharacterized protein n=1 Tax=Dreissena polymorpha TaxID=45954 RepID=A0A9D4D933_DREPO|nr:hypothetical protein DPMN_048176 [Dreissena polymorpha]
MLLPAPAMTDTFSEVFFKKGCRPPGYVDAAPSSAPTPPSMPHTAPETHNTARFPEHFVHWL